MFKLPNPDDQEACLTAYKKLSADQSKDGKPYIASCNAYKLYDDPRNQGYTIAAKTSFHSLEDMRYYDDECEAHKTLKATVGPKAAGPPLTVYHEV